jgi:hypothetical protein
MICTSLRSDSFEFITGGGNDFPAFHGYMTYSDSHVASVIAPPAFGGVARRALACPGAIPGLSDEAIQKVFAYM